MASRVQGITIEINGDTKGLDSALSEVNSKASGVAKDLSDVNKLLKLDPGNATLLAQKFDLLKSSVEQTQEKLKLLSDAESQVKSQFESGDIGKSQYQAFERELEATKASLGHAEDGLKNTKLAMLDMGGAEAKAEAGFKSIGSSAQKAGSDVGEASTKLDSAKDKASKFSETMKGSFVGNMAANAMQDIAGKVEELGGDMMAAADASRNFASQLSGMHVDSGQIKEAQSTVEELGSKFGYTAQTVETGMTKMAANGVKNFPQVTQALATMNQASGGSQESFGNLTNILGKTFSSGSLNAGAFAKMLKQMPEGAKLLQQEIEKDGGTITSLNTALSKGAVSSDTLAEAFQTVGGKFQGSTKDVAAATAAMDKVQSSGKLTVQQYDLIAKAVPGGANAMGAAMQKAGATTLNFNQALKDGTISSTMITNAMEKVGNSDAMKKQAEKSLTMSQQMDRIKEATISAGEQIIGSFSGGNVSAAIDSLIAIIKSVGETISNIVKFVQANKAWIEPLAIGIAAVVAAINLWAIATKVQAAAQLALDAGMLPEIAVIAAIVAVIALVVAAVQHWGDIVNWLKGVWSGIADFFKGLWDGVVKLFSDAVKGVQGVWSGVTKFFSDIWQGIVTVFSVVVTFYAQIFGDAWNGIKAIWNAVVGFFSGIWSGIVAIFNVVASFFGQIFGDAWNGIKVIWSAVIGFFSGAWRGITIVFSVVASWFGNTFNGAWNAIKNAFSSVASFFSGIWSGITGALGKAVDWFKQLGSGMWSGLTSAFSNVAKFFGNIGSSIWSAIKGGLKGVLSAVPVVGGAIIKALGLATGGYVSGEGTGTSDSIPAMLSNGEYVINAASVNKYGKSFMDMLNSGKFSTGLFQTGGAFTKPKMFSSQAQGTPVKSASTSATASLSSPEMVSLLQGILQAVQGININPVMAVDGKLMGGAVTAPVNKNLGKMMTLTQRGVTTG